MSVEVKCLTIELFLKSHIVISTSTEEKIHKLCREVFSYEAEYPDMETHMPEWDEKAMKYIKQITLKAFTKIKKGLPDSDQKNIDKSIEELESAQSAEDILALVETVSAATR